jgi:hypothetical protein
VVLVPVLLSLVVIWYVLRAVAVASLPVRRLVGRWSVWTGRAHAWVMSAPATFTYMAIFTASTTLQRNAPPRLITLLTTLQSTNLARLSTKPLVVLTSSALWVANRGAGLSLYLVVFATLVAWAERRYGTPRIVLIGVTGHVLGSLLTAAVELHAIRDGHAPQSLAMSTDVGVSYIMVAGCAAAVLAMRGRTRAVFALLLVAGIVTPLVINRTVWDLGHLLATTCGLAMAALTLIIRPLRTPVDVDDLARHLRRRPPTNQMSSSLSRFAL